MKKREIVESEEPIVWRNCNFVPTRYNELAITADYPKIKSLYIMGSMRNPEVPIIAKTLRDKLGLDVFDDWYSPGEQTDEKWQEHERLRGRLYKEALDGWHAKDVFEFDKRHLDRCDAGLLVLPAGKSAHIELGYLRGLGKPAWILFDEEPERFDLMYKFATEIFFSLEETVDVIKGYCGCP